MWTTRTRVGLWLWRCISLARSRLCLYLSEPGCYQRKLWKGKYSFCLWCSGSYPGFCVFQASYQFIEYIPGQYVTFQRLVFSGHSPKSSHGRRWLPGSTQPSEHLFALSLSLLKISEKLIQSCFTQSCFICLYLSRNTYSTFNGYSCILSMLTSNVFLHIYILLLALWYMRTFS